MFRQVWYKAINPEAIVAVFQKVGVYPFSHQLETLDTEHGDEEDLSGDNLSDQEEGGGDYSGDLDPEEDRSPSFDLNSHLKKSYLKPGMKMGMTYSSIQAMFHG